MHIYYVYSLAYRTYNTSCGQKNCILTIRLLLALARLVRLPWWSPSSSNDHIVIKWRCNFSVMICSLQVTFLYIGMLIPVYMLRVHSLRSMELADSMHCAGCLVYTRVDWYFDRLQNDNIHTTSVLRKHSIQTAVCKEHWTWQINVRISSKLIWSWFSTLQLEFSIFAVHPSAGDSTQRKHPTHVYNHIELEANLTVKTWTYLNLL